MKLRILTFFCFFSGFFLALPSVHALDLKKISENNAVELRAAIEAEGGTVQGDPVVVTAPGPDGTPMLVFSFPAADCYITLPVAPPSNHWTLTGAILVDKWGFEVSAGAVLGVLFGPNDYVLGLGLGKWSKTKAIFLQSGLKEVIPESELQAAKVPAVEAWQKITIKLSGTDFNLHIGDAFEKSGVIEEDGRNALQRRTKLFIRLGTFQGKATLPVLQAGS